MSAARGGMARASSLAGSSFEASSMRSMAWVAQLRRMGAWVLRQPVLQPKLRRLQVQETVQLGEKRFVSILRVDGEQFLIGGSSAGVTLLAAMQPEATASFATVLETERRQACA